MFSKKCATYEKHKEWKILGDDLETLLSFDKRRDFPSSSHKILQSVYKDIYPSVKVGKSSNYYCKGCINYVQKWCVQCNKQLHGCALNGLFYSDRHIVLE